METSGLLYKYIIWRLYIQYSRELSRLIVLPVTQDGLGRPSSLTDTFCRAKAYTISTEAAYGKYLPWKL
jgi:hypothetical protein